MNPGSDLLIEIIVQLGSNGITIDKQDVVKKRVELAEKRKYPNFNSKCKM